MSNENEEEVGLDEKIDNTVIKIGKWSFTPAKLTILVGVVSSVLGGLYGAFEVYKDYMDMKAAIQEYVEPDLSGMNERISKIEERMEKVQILADESNEMIRDVRVDLKGDLDTLQADVDAAERRNRELDKEVRGFVGVTDRDMSARLRTIERETDQKLKELERKVDEKIQKAWENPLAK